MDINEVKKFIQNKIETDKLTQKVRTVIKEKKWEKQDLKEGFKQSFKPLIKPQKELNEKIQQQNKENNEQIQQIQENQLALTEGLAANRLALTEGLQTLGQLLAIEQGRDGQEEDPFSSIEADLFEDAQDEPYLDPKTGAIPKKKATKVLNPEHQLTPAEVYELTNRGFVRPNNLADLNKNQLDDLLKKTNKEIQFTNGALAGLGRKKNKTKKDKDEIKVRNEEKRMFKNYKSAIEGFLLSLQFQTGSGVYFNNPHQLLKRLELLAGSILAGNNGAIPEFSQLVHFLNQINVISKKQLNDLLKNYLNIR